MVDPILALGNALIMLDRVECKGRANHDALLFAMQQVDSVLQAMKEAKKSHDTDNGQGADG